MARGSSNVRRPLLPQLEPMQPRTCSDTVAVSDAGAVLAAASRARSATDTVALSDGGAVRSAMAKARSATDTVLLVDAGTQGLQGKSEQENVAVSDAGSQGVAGKLAQDTVNVVDVGAAPNPSAAQDTVAVVDVGTQGVQGKSEQDTVAILDLGAGQLHALYRSGADTVLVVDVGAVQHGTRARSAQDTVAVQDLRTTRRTALDTVLVADWTFVVQVNRALLTIRERPPLRLHLAIATPSGLRARWGEDHPNPALAPSGLSFSTVMPGGFEALSCVLQRDPSFQYPDLEKFSTIGAFGADGECAWEGRLEASPATAGQQAQIAPGAVGYQSALSDDSSVREIYVDRQISSWTAPFLDRQLLYAHLYSVNAQGPQTAPDAFSGFPALTTGVTGSWTDRQVIEAWYDSQQIPLGSLYAAWEGNPHFKLAAGGWVASMFLADDDAGTSQDSFALPGTYGGHSPAIAGTPGISNNISSGQNTLQASKPSRVFACLQFANTQIPGGADGTNYFLYWPALAVYGRHGLTVYGPADFENAPGVLCSDVIANAIGRWAPEIALTLGESGTVKPTSFIIPHLAFTSPTTVANVIAESCKYELPDWAVWEGPTFHLGPRNAGGRKWRSRTGPAQLQSAGSQISRIFNGVVVQFTDPTGLTRYAGPPGATVGKTDQALLDADPENPANQAGIRRYAQLSMGTSTYSGAIQVGERFLQEQKLLDVAGQASLVAHVLDDRGVLWPAWNVRAGDQISFVDSSDPSYRRIVHTSYEHSTRTNAVQLDQPPDSLQALLARLSVVLTPYGMS